MNQSTLIICLVNVLTILAGIFVASLVAYGKRKGEINAENENFRTLLEQVKETTEAQKRIEARITDEVWDRQEQWKLKRDAILQAIRSIAAIKESLAGLDSCFSTSLPESEALKQKQMEERNAFKETNSNLWCAKFVAEVVVGTDLNEYLYQFYQEAARIAGNIMKGNSSHFKSPEVKKALADKTNAVIREARKELGMPDRGDLITLDTDH